MIRLIESGLLNAMFLFGAPIRPHLLPLLSVVDGLVLGHAGRTLVGLDSDGDAVGAPRPAPSPALFGADRAGCPPPGGPKGVPG